MKMILGEVYVLDSDFQEPLLQTGAQTHVKYTKLNFSERVINQTRFEDIYVLESGRYYFITFKNEIKGDKYLIEDKLFASGLIVQMDIKNNKMYLYNASDNLIYLKNECKLGVIE